MEKPIPIIDIFAGPGGLGEGFSTLKSDDEKPVFKIKLSIEKDETAHKTLELRAFYRQFSDRAVPPEYYEYLKGNISRKKLFRKYKVEAAAAKEEAWKKTLGFKRELVKSKIDAVLRGANNWVLIGGPPCQAYSLIGRSRMRSTDEKKYEKDRRHFLYKEYLQILADHRPSVFVMENVKGLLSAKLQQQKTLDLILSDLQNPSRAVGNNSGQVLSYKLFSISKRRQEKQDKIKPEDFVVRCEDYGIPQARHRIIILGIRSDIFKTDPAILANVNQVFIDDVIGDLPELRSGLSKETDSADKWCSAVKSIVTKKWLETVDPFLRMAIINRASEVNLNMTRGGNFVSALRTVKVYSEWYVDSALNGVCNHETRRHIRDDLHRYFFAAMFAIINDRSPTLKDFPDELLPAHGNIAEALSGSKFNDRFRVQVVGKPSTTVVSHISKDGHYYIHYDPLQCRSLTVREAARLQTFPDNYFFEGNRTKQYHQVGNAVPPLLANKIAAIVYQVLQNSN